MKKQYVVVDDDRTNSLICQFIIRKYDKYAPVYPFNQPKECLDWIRESQSHGPELEQTILFLDINMPTMTGWEFLDAFMAFNESIRSRFVIYILSSSLEDYSEKAKLYPFVSGFLSKPLQITHLETII